MLIGGELSNMAVSGNVVFIRALRGNGGLAVLSVIRVCDHDEGRCVQFTFDLTNKMERM